MYLSSLSKHTASIHVLETLYVQYVAHHDPLQYVAHHDLDVCTNSLFQQGLGHQLVSRLPVVSPPVGLPLGLELQVVDIFFFEPGPSCIKSFCSCPIRSRVLPRLAPFQ
jgi:hypothetical protein